MERECGWAALQTAGQQEREGHVWIGSYFAAYVYTHSLTQLKIGNLINLPGVS